MSAATPDQLRSDIARIALQQSTLVLPAFSAEIAWQLGTLLHGLCLDRGHALIIDIRRFGSPHQQLFFAAVGDTPPDLERWVARKVNVVARLHRSSYEIGLGLQLEQKDFAARYGFPNADSDFAPHGGSFPITVANAGIVGAVTLSGLPQREDHALVVEALCQLTGHDLLTVRLD
jgi:uncharacterized protein (UPF0303 family)